VQPGQITKADDNNGVRMKLLRAIVLYEIHTMLAYPFVQWDFRVRLSLEYSLLEINIT